ncbi:MAG: amylo-alpha-1,6-glucosidase [bacterium]
MKIDLGFNSFKANITTKNKENSNAIDQNADKINNANITTQVQTSKPQSNPITNVINGLNLHKVNSNRLKPLDSDQFKTPTKSNINQNQHNITNSGVSKPDIISNAPLIKKTGTAIKQIISAIDNTEKSINNLKIQPDKIESIISEENELPIHSSDLLEISASDKTTKTPISKQIIDAINNTEKLITPKSDFSDKNKSLKNDIQIATSKTNSTLQNQEVNVLNNEIKSINGHVDFQDDVKPTTDKTAISSIKRQQPISQQIIDTINNTEKLISPKNRPDVNDVANSSQIQMVDDSIIPANKEIKELNKEVKINNEKKTEPISKQIISAINNTEKLISTKNQTEINNLENSNQIVEVDDSIIPNMHQKNDTNIDEKTKVDQSSLAVDNTNKKAATTTLKQIMSAIDNTEKLINPKNQLNPSKINLSEDIKPKKIQISAIPNLVDIKENIQIAGKEVKIVANKNMTFESCPVATWNIKIDEDKSVKKQQIQFANGSQNALITTYKYEAPLNAPDLDIEVLANKNPNNFDTKLNINISSSTVNKNESLKENEINKKIITMKPNETVSISVSNTEKNINIKPEQIISRQDQGIENALIKARIPTTNEAKEAYSLAKQFISIGKEINSNSAADKNNNADKEAITLLPTYALTLKRNDMTRNSLKNYSEYVKNVLLTPDLKPKDNVHDDIIKIAMLWSSSLNDFSNQTQSLEDLDVIKEQYSLIKNIMNIQIEETKNSEKSNVIDNDGLIKLTNSQNTLTSVSSTENCNINAEGKSFEANVLWYNGLKSLSDIAKTLGYTSEHEKFSTMANIVQQNLMKFWDENQNGFNSFIDKSNPELSKIDNTSLLTALTVTNRPFVNKPELEAAILNNAESQIFPEEDNLNSHVKTIPREKTAQAAQYFDALMNFQKTNPELVSDIEISENIAPIINNLKKDMNLLLSMNKPLNGIVIPNIDAIQLTNSNAWTATTVLQLIKGTENKIYDENKKIKTVEENKIQQKNADVITSEQPSKIVVQKPEYTNKPIAASEEDSKISALEKEIITEPNIQIKKAIIPTTKQVVTESIKIAAQKELKDAQSKLIIEKLKESSINEGAVNNPEIAKSRRTEIIKFTKKSDKEKDNKEELADGVLAEIMSTFGDLMQSVFSGITNGISGK